MTSPQTWNVVTRREKKCLREEKKVPSNWSSQKAQKGAYQQKLLISQHFPLLRRNKEWYLLAPVSGLSPQVGLQNPPLKKFESREKKILTTNNRIYVRNSLILLT